MRPVAAALTGATLAVAVLLGGLQAIGIGSEVVKAGVPSVLAAADTVAVDITEDGFNPSNVTVAIGGTVSWTNSDSDTHSVVGEPGSGLESPALQRWGMYSRTFRVVGTIAYHDGQNPELTGIINVVDGDASPPAPERPARVEDDSAPAGPPVNTETSASSVAGTVVIDAGSDWFGNSGFQNAVYETTIQAGDTVQWNIVEAVHTVYECGDSFSGANSCTDAAWNSDILSAGDTFSQQFNTAGTYSYLCTLHPLTMRGAITVQGSAPAAADPPAPAAPVTGPSTDPAPAPDSGPSASGPEGSAAGPDAVPSAGFGPPSGGADLNDYLPLSVLVMAAAGLTFIGSSAMLIRHRVAGAQAAAVNGWAPTMAEPLRFRQERADAPSTAATGGTRRNAVPTLRPCGKPGDLATVPSKGDRVAGPATETPKRPALASDDFEMLRARLASINERFARIARKFEER